MPVILVDKNFIIFDSSNITISNVVFKNLMLLHSYHHGDLWLVECISSTIENVTLIVCGLLGFNLIRESYLNNIIINLTKSSNRENKCYDHQGISLYYNISLSKEKNLKAASDLKSIIIMQKI